MKKFILCIISLSTAIWYGCSSSSGEITQDLPYYNTADFTPVWLPKDSRKDTKLHQIPSFAFVNQQGKTITEKTVHGKIYVADFFFTSCPGICPMLTQNMRLIQDAFKNSPDVLLLSHSVMPEYDSVAVLKNYADHHGIVSQNWHLLTGKREEIYAIARKSYFADEDLGLKKDGNAFLHTENFILIDQNRHIRGIYKGTSRFEVNQLIEDIKLLQNSPVIY
jgi:protein SCO1/2